ncbi:hypothetical protein MLD52_10900 [Puniceicoccaceae bacterium K14]|nr:hypothetical protein [Puniceicoccaceae bacterium K14]
MNLHQILIDAKVMLHFAAAGAGPAFATRLWQTPGSSQYLTGSTLIQARNKLDRFIGFEPDDHKYCNRDVAIDMAITAYIRACQTIAADATEARKPIGAAVTAAVATSQLPRGKQRAHIAIICEGGVFHHEIVFEKNTGQDARQAHDNLIADTMEQLLTDIISEEIQSESDETALKRIAHHSTFMPDGSRLKESPSTGLYFPANFNPMHDGHRHACLEAERITGLKAVFHIEATPPNKQALSIADLLRRIASLQDKEPVETQRPITVTQGEPNYIDKARKRPGSHFIAGADAVSRLLEPNWGYVVDHMLAELDDLNTKFFVLGRHDGANFVTVHDLEINSRFRHLFIHLDGQHDISSTQLRAEIGK